MSWVRFTLVQIVMLLATVLGWFILPIPCILQAWRISPKPSIKDGRQIDEWKFNWLNKVYGNPEDGVSGRFAKLSDGSAYLPNCNSILRAYTWSAIRNSADGLKYLFADPNGPLVDTWVHVKIGYQEENGFKVPVFSVKPE